MAKINLNKIWNRLKTRASVQGVVALGGNFATLCQEEVDFYETFFFALLIFKRRGKYFYTFNHSYSEKSSNRAKHKSATMTPKLLE